MLTVLPEDGALVALHVEGQITRRDIDRATAAIDEALVTTSGPVPLLIIVGDIGFMTPPALLADIKYGVRNIRNLKRFERVAVVTDSRLVQAFAGAQDLLVPRVSVKSFSRADEAVARHWLTGIADAPPAPDMPGPL